MSFIYMYQHGVLSGITVRWRKIPLCFSDGVTELDGIMEPERITGLAGQQLVLYLTELKPNGINFTRNIFYPESI